MADQEISRKLAVIVHADVVGSTALVQRDETLAHKRINEAFQRLSSIIQEYSGTVHEIRGDALVAGFTRASDAVCAALRFQQSHTAHNAKLNDDIVPVVRIGIALGEEVFADDTVTGAGVVLAQRVEQLSEPGGVCITGAIHEAIPHRMPFDQESLGEKDVKGFDEPVRVYRVVLKPGAAVPEAETSEQPQSPSQTRRLIVAFAAVALVVAAGVVFWLKPWAPEFEPASVERMALPLPDKPSIAVLPFTNLSADPAQDYFVDGITESIITALSKVPNLFIIARNSTFTYKGKPVKTQQVAEELGVRYVLDGSVQRASDRVRITTQLIDAIAGNYLWSERYDRNVKDIFALQDEITLNVVTQLEVVLTEGDMARVQYHGTDNLEAVLLVAQSRQYVRRLTKEDNRRARELAQKAIELDPEFAQPYTSLGWTHYLDAQAGWSASPIESFKRAVALAQKARKLDDTHPDTYALLGVLHLLLKEHDEAIAYAEKAIALSLNDAGNLALLAFILNYAGESKKALALLDKAMRLSPYYPDWYLGELGRAYILTGQYDEAIAALAQRLRRNPNSGEAQVLLAAAYGASGRNEEARAMLAEFLKPRSGYTLEQYAQGEFYKNPEDLQRVLDGLRKAGLAN